MSTPGRTVRSTAWFRTIALTLQALSIILLPSIQDPLDHVTTALAVSVHGLRKRYADAVAVDGLDLEIATGECSGLLGPNVAGKTTTIEICEGLTAPDDGH